MQALFGRTFPTYLLNCATARILSGALLHSACLTRGNRTKRAGRALATFAFDPVDWLQTAVLDSPPACLAPRAASGADAARAGISNGFSGMAKDAAGAATGRQRPVPTSLSLATEPARHGGGDQGVD